MYPKDIIPGVSLYVILICVGIIACFITFSKLSDKRKIHARVHNLALACGILGIAVGLGSAVLFQALYNIASLGGFEINESTGATFYGGLIGGAAIFLAVYFIVGGVKIKDKKHLTEFFPLISCIAPAIAVAHGFGRLGCLMAGCCHGKLTDSWLGIMMYGNHGYAKYVPTQLFEAIFLFLLCALLVVMTLERKKYVFTTYVVSYGIWRFIIEYVRADYRGESFVSFLTPSQIAAIGFIIAGIMLGVIEHVTDKKLSLTADATEECADE